MQSAQQNTIYFDENFSVNDVNESLVGRKGLSLFRLKDTDVPVPHFFVVSSEVYANFIYRTLGENIQTYLKEKKLPDPLQVKDAIMNMEFSLEIQEELLKAYAKLSGFSQSWVSVRSSVAYLPNSGVNFPGVFKTEVNVRGYDDLVNAIKNIYASVFTDSVVGYARQHNIDLSQLRMPVVVQKMIQAEVSGITYTQDLITLDSSKMSIEAVFGLGDVIATGQITPDRYVFKKDDLSFIEKNISPQDWMHVRSLKTKGTGGVEKIAISSAWSHRQKLEDRFLKEIAKTCLLIEDSLGAHQNIEWVWESGKIWVIQHKSIYIPAQQQSQSQTSSSGILDPVLGVLKHKEQLKKEEQDLSKAEIKQPDVIPEQEHLGAQEELDLDLLVEKENQRNVQGQSSSEKELDKISEQLSKMAQQESDRVEKATQKKTEKIVKERSKVVDSVAKNFLSESLDLNNFRFLLDGIGVSSGTKVGQVVHVNAKNYKDLLISRENIIIVEEVFDGIRDVLFRAGGVLMDTGGITSDIAIQCREIGIPAVVGASVSSQLLRDGDFAKIDAGSGGVYVYAKEEFVNKELSEPEVKEAEKETGKETRVDIEYEVVEDIERKFDDFKTTSVKDEKKCIIEQKQEIPRTATKVYVSDKQIQGFDQNLIEYIDGVIFCDLEQFMLDEKRHPLAFLEDENTTAYVSKLAKRIDEYADKFVNSEIVVSLGSHASGEFADLVKGKGYEKDTSMRGVARYLENIELAKLALKIVSRARNVHRNKNISLALHSPFNAENMKEIKKQVLSLGLRRSSSFKLYAVIDNPSEVLLLEDIVSTNIDGIIINTPVLARQMQGLGVYDEKAKYALDTNSLFKTLEKIKDALINYKVDIVGITENNRDLVKKYIELGVCGIVVDPEKFVEIKRLTSEKETEIILSRGKV